MHLTRVFKRLVLTIGTAASALSASVASAEWGYNFPTPVTSIGHTILNLHNLIFFICLVIFAVVSLFMFWSVFAHRKSKGHKASQFSHSTFMEIVWTVIPVIILVAMAIPSTKALIMMEDTSDSDLTVKVTGYQWKWEYEYLDKGVSFFSNLATPAAQIQGAEEKGENYLLEVDKPLVLPTGKKIRFLLTASDVIHAWWVPEFGAKKDAVPGYINEIWTNIDKPGTYRGQCAELCGKDHGFMPIVVEAVSPEDFDKYIADSKSGAAVKAVADDRSWGKEELLARGEQVYGQCQACHGADGQGIPGAFPAIAGSAVATGPVDGHLDIVMNGKTGTAMQAYAQQLSDADLAAVVTYQRNAFGNNAGDSVQPSQVKSLR